MNNKLRVLVKIILLACFVCFTATMASATTYTFVGNGNWDNANNWDANGVPPNPLPAGSEIIINPPQDAYGNWGQPVLNVAYEIDTGATLTIFPVAGTERALRIEGGGLINSGTVTINGTLSVSDNSTFINQGTLVLGDQSRVTTGGTFTNSSRGTISVASGGRLRVEGSLTNEGTLENRPGGTVETLTDATLNNQGTFDNRGTFSNYGTLTGNAPVTPAPAP